jgi:DNA polymerase elongation subunit (family B)
MWCRIVDCEYTVETDGYKQATPIIHLFGRDTSWRRHHVRVRGFQPYLCVRVSEWQRCGEAVADDDRVQDVRTVDERGRPETALDGERLVRICTREPEDVADLRELFDDPFEADVQFPTRFLIDMARSQWVRIEGDVGEDPIPISAVHRDGDPPERTPPFRVCTYDIEVAQGGDGPSVVSTEGTERAANPITAITAHDSYTDEYAIWMTAHPAWDRPDYEAAHGERGLGADAPETTGETTAADADPDGVTPRVDGGQTGVHPDVETFVYENPHDTVAQFCSWVTDRDFDALTAWNGSAFDHPYLVNYGLTNSISAVRGLSPLDVVYPMDGDGQWINSSLKGRLLLDSLTLYQKSQIHELSSYRLADVAEAEGVSVGKLDLDSVIDADGPAIDHAWKHEPSVFRDYSLRDVQACVAINRESQKGVTII